MIPANGCSNAGIESRTSAIVIDGLQPSRSDAGEQEQVMSYGPRHRPTLRIWSMFGAAAVGYGQDQYRI